MSKTMMSEQMRLNSLHASLIQCAFLCSGDFLEIIYVYISEPVA